MLQSIEIIQDDSELVQQALVAVTSEDLDRIVGISPIAAFVLDENHRVTTANPPFGRVIGRPLSEVKGVNFRNLIADPAGQLPAHGTWELLHGDGKTVSLEAVSRLLPDGRNLVFVTDDTGRKLAEASALETERKRWQSQRIEALGRLAGGIAHDFNNFLAVLLLQLDIINLHLEAESPIRGRVNDIKEASNSVAGTVRQLFAFGRKQPMTLAPVELNALISDFAEEFRATSVNTSIELVLEPSLGLCFVDRLQIRQVLRNLAEFANEGMPGGGAINIRTRNVLLDSDSAPSVQPSGEYVEIAVSDTGTGLEPTDEEFVFEPFFSTKESDKGAGLTLAMVFGTVKQSKGFIWAEANAGAGKTFRLQFPRIDVTKPETLSDDAAAAEPGDRRTVLVVDDSESVRRVTVEFLKMFDYDVIQAGSGMEALEVAQSFNGPIHVLLTDLSMPLMDGRQVAEKIVGMHPETAVLYMSGNIEHIGDEDLINDANINFIGKPFSSTSLAEKVREVLRFSSS